MNTYPINATALNTIFQEMPAICMVIDCNLKIVAMNQQGYTMLDQPSDALRGQSCLPLYAEDEQVFIEQNLQRIFTAASKETLRWECTRQRSDGSCFWARDTVRLISSPENTERQVLILSEDITETRYLINELKRTASIDPLTGIDNRRQFERHLNQMIFAAQNSNIQNTLCHIDLDQFKVVNDVAGYLAGDELLRQICQQIRRNIRSEDILGRIGGDEFGLLFRECELNQAHRIANKVMDSIRNFCFNWEEKAFHIGASIGMLKIEPEFTSPKECLSMAEAACFAAKAKGQNNILVYSPSDHHVTTLNRLQRQASTINWAMGNDAFELHYQRIYPFRQPKKREQIEILIRMHDPQGNLIAPGEFIPAAEHYGLSTKIDLWVTENTLRHFHALKDGKQYICNINLSGKTLVSKEFIANASTFLEKYKAPHYQVCFEITETAAISNMVFAREFISHFKQFGCLFALDDFGSGFSTFNYLKNLDIDFLKIDGFFVKNLLNEFRNLALIQAMRDVAAAYGIPCIAEFVESQAIADKLNEIGVESGQGYFFHKPEPVSQLDG